VILKNVTTVTVLTGVNIIVTLLNQIVLAYLFGAGASMDAFLTCGAVPFVILNMAIGDLGYVLVPMLMQYEKTGGLEEAANSSFTTVSLLATVITVLGIIGHRWILHLTTADNMPAHTFDIAVSIAPIMWVVIGLTIVGSYLTGIHYYRREFTLPSLTMGLPYLGMMAGGILGARHLGILSIVLGWASATFIRCATLYIGLRGSGLRLCTNIFHPASIKLMKSLPVLGLSLLPFAALPMIDVYWASRLPVGSISYLGYSNRIVIALTSIVVQGLSIVLFPDLSKDVVNGHLEIFRQKVIDAIKIIFLAIVPLAVLATIVRMPILVLVLQRGKFTSVSSLGVARVLPYYLLGTIWMAVMNIVIRGFYALQDYKSPAKIGVVAIMFYTVISGILIRSYSYLGIGVAYSVYWVLLFIVQSHYLGKAVGILLNRNLLVFIGKVLLSSLLAAFVLIAMLDGMNIKMRSGADLIVQGMSEIILYFIISHYVFRLPQYRMVFSAIHRMVIARRAV